MGCEWCSNVCGVREVYLRVPLKRFEDRLAEAHWRIASHVSACACAIGICTRSTHAANTWCSGLEPPLPIGTLCEWYIPY